MASSSASGVSTSMILNADRANRGVVDVARVRRDDHLVLVEAGEVRNPNVEIGVAARDARRGRVRHRRGAAGADHAPLGSGQLGQPLADRVHQLVELDVLLIRGALRRAHFRQLRRAADDRERAPAVDQRPNADRLVDVRSVAAADSGSLAAAADTVRSAGQDASRPEHVPRPETLTPIAGHLSPHENRAEEDASLIVAPVPGSVPSHRASPVGP